MIKTHNLNFHYQNNSPLIQNLNLETLPGDKIAIIGKNGKGKSTLLKLLSNQLSPTTGTVKINPSLQIGYFGQESKNNLNPNKSILEEFTSLHNITDQEARKMCSLLLFDKEAIKKPIKVLSGGEKNRVCLGKAILQTNQILILDEPTNHLDLESAQALIQAMQDFKGLLIFVSHDEDMIEKVANKLIVFDNNQQIIFNENYTYFLKNKGWSQEQVVNNLPKKNKSENSPQEIRQIKKQINTIEKKIAKLEKEEIENGKKLQTACFEKDHQKIKEFGQKAKDLHDEINILFQEFEQLLNQEI